MSKKQSGDVTVQSSKSIPDAYKSKSDNRFPRELKENFDLLIPKPLPGIRFPLADLFKRIHEIALGVSRLGPLTATQLAEDLKKPYATIAGNTLIMGVMMAYAQMDYKTRLASALERSELIKVLMKYFNLNESDRQEFELSSGKIMEPANPGIPYGPEKLQQLTTKLTNLTVATNETLARHQEEWRNFNSTVSKRVLSESPNTVRINNIVKEINDNPNRSASVKEQLTSKIQAASDKIDKQAVDEISKIKPISAEAKKIVEESHAAVEEKDKSVSGDKKPVKLDFEAKDAMLIELKTVAATRQADQQKKMLAEAIASTPKEMNDRSITDEKLVTNFEDKLNKVSKESSDISNDAGLSASFTKIITKIHTTESNKFYQETQARHKIEINNLNEVKDDLIMQINQASQGLEKTADKSH